MRYDRAMRSPALAFLVCPTCAGSLTLTAADVEAEEIISGQLGCQACAASFPIERGVPRFAGHGLEDAARTRSAWRLREAGPGSETRRPLIVWVYGARTTVDRALRRPGAEGVDLATAAPLAVPPHQIPAAMLYFASHAIYRPLSRPPLTAVGQRLFYQAYINALGLLPFRGAPIVHDHLGPRLPLHSRRRVSRVVHQPSASRCRGRLAQSKFLRGTAVRSGSSARLRQRQQRALHAGNQGV